APWRPRHAAKSRRRPQTRGLPAWLMCVLFARGFFVLKSRAYMSSHRTWAVLLVADKNWGKSDHPSCQPLSADEPLTGHPDRLPQCCPTKSFLNENAPRDLRCPLPDFHVASDCLRRRKNNFHRTDERRDEPVPRYIAAACLRRATRSRPNRPNP